MKQKQHLADVVVCVYEPATADMLRDQLYHEWYERVSKAGPYSYKNDGKQEDQAKNLPDLRQ